MSMYQSQSDNQYKDAIETKRALLNTYLGKIFGAERAAQLLTFFFIDVTQKIDQLKKHLYDRNMVEIRKIAHALKGSGKSYGFEYISQTGRDLSICAKREDYSGLSDLIRNLERYARKQKEILG